MRRRALLVAAGSISFAGCVTDLTGSTTDEESDPGDESDGGERTTVEPPTLAEQGRPTTICEESIKPDGIRALVEPAFGSPREFPEDPDGYQPLADEQTVIGIEAAGEARAYPLTILNVHEIVNDALGGPMIVTYCPICRSGMVADRWVDGEVATFDVSGLLWRAPGINAAASEKDDRVFSDREEGVGNNGNLVMYDSVTGSYWSQMLAQAICGPMAEERLSVRSASTATWREWRADHPDTVVLLPPPASTIVNPPV
ncbi:hypothetical protein BRD19_07930 [Halobacteriales archaeon SW_7_65_23]|nr:MAG: hypothetical protein BRD19_07930 [Halobacteriales archaeon SW_7_65_23]